MSVTGPSIGFAQNQQDTENPQWGLPEWATVRLGKGTVNEISYSPDGTRLAVAGSIGVWIYDARTEEAVALFTGHTDIVSSATFSPDGGTLASGSWDNTVRLRDARTGETKKTLLGHSDRVVSIAYSPDGGTIASGSWDNSVRLWDARTGQLKTILGHTHWVHTVAYSPGGGAIAAGAQNGSVHIWDAASGEAIAEFLGHTEAVDSVAYSPDGSVIASGARDGEIRLWDVPTGESIAALAEHTGAVNSVTFSPDGSLLASGGEDSSVRLWNVTAREAVAALTEHGSSLRSVAYSPDGARIVSASDDGAIHVWDVDSRETVSAIAGHGATAQAVAYSTDGKLLAIGSDVGVIRLWDIERRYLKAVLTGHTDQIRSVAFSPDGSTLVSAGGRDLTVRLWDVATGQSLAVLRGHTGGVLFVAFSPDGDTLASAGGYRDNTIRLWDVPTRQTKAILTGHTSWVRALAFSPDGSTLVSAGGFGDQSVRLWDVLTGETKAILSGHSSWVQTVAFSPDGGTLASGGNDTTVRLWDTRTGENKAVLTGHTYEVFSVAFSPDGGTLASAGPRTLRLWNADTGYAIAALTGNVYGTRSVTYSPDGKTLASTGTDGTALLWDLSLLLSEADELQTAVSQIQRQDDGQPGVRLAYFYPSDREPQSGINEQADRIIKDVQVFYAREMQRHGYGIKTFTYEADAAGNVAVHYIKGQFEEAHYREGAFAKISEEIDAQFDRTENIFFVFLEVSGEFLGRDVCGLGGAHGATGGAAMFPASGDCFSFRIVAHELGHALGLFHDHRFPNLMSGSAGYLSQLSSCAAQYLAAHPLFDGGASDLMSPPIVNRLPPLAAPSEDIHIRFAAVDADGLHLAQLYANATPEDPLPGLKLLGCLPLNGASANFGFIITELTASPSAAITLRVIDTHGNKSAWWYPNAIEGLIPLDVNGDGVLDLSDLTALSPYFGQTGNQDMPDMNGDGEVNVLDLVLVAGFLDVAAAPPTGWNDQHSGLTRAELQQWLTQARRLNPADAVSRRGIAALENVLAALAPKETALLPNYPNPFNPETWIPYRLARPAEVTLRIYSANGAVVRTLSLGHQSTGTYLDQNRAAYWDGVNDHGESVASGVYFYTLTAGDFSATRKMLILK